MTAIITNLTIPTGVTVSGQTISGSLLFAGSGQYLVTSANNAFATGTNDFTVEGWAWIDPACDSLAGLVTNASSSRGGFWVAVDGTGMVAPAGSGGNGVGWLATLPYSTWFHFALTMQSNTIRLFKDGVLQGTTTRTSYTSTGTIAAIGSRYADSTAYTFKGYMSNVRIIAGIALYTSAFTVPLGPLSVTQYSNQNGSPSAAINTLGSTALLMNTINNASYLNDSSNYDLTLSAYSGPAPTSSALNPFTYLDIFEYLVVAGGGGGAWYGGGGGAGGLLTGTGLSLLTSTAIPITVGAGGTGGGTGTNGGTGQNSSINNTAVLAYGGGYGIYSGVAGQAGSGGSGGGGPTNSNLQSGSRGYGVYPGSPYISAPRQGYDGGDGVPSNTDYAAGGGGAGGQGSLAAYAPAGGSGLSSSITGTATYYAGGGGGGGWLGNGAGGQGGGGQGGTGGATGTNGGAGTANTGGGGGGSGYNPGVSGQGGSGVVIIRYPDSYAAALSTTSLAAGYPVVSGGYRIYKWNSSGSITF